MNRESKIRTEEIEDSFATIAIHLQYVLVPTEEMAYIAPIVEANNELVARGAARLLQMEDHPGTFDRWCIAFALRGDQKK